MCESNFRRALLEQPFRVWLSGSVCEYDVTLTPVSVILRPCSSGKGRGAAAASCCSRICSRTSSAKIEVFGRDLLSCRPAHGIPKETKVHKGCILSIIILTVKHYITALFFFIFHVHDAIHDSHET